MKANKIDITETIERLHDEGYAVIIWTPEELQAAPIHKVEERSIEEGWEIIRSLQ